jgi:hypothetical protein
MLGMDDVAFALRRVGARLSEAQMDELFELLGEDPDDPDSLGEVAYEDLIELMHRDDDDVLASLSDDDDMSTIGGGSSSSSRKGKVNPSPGPPPTGPPPPLGPPTPLGARPVKSAPPLRIGDQAGAPPPPPNRGELSNLAKKDRQAKAQAPPAPPRGRTGAGAAQAQEPLPPGVYSLLNEDGTTRSGPNVALNTHNARQTQKRLHAEKDGKGDTTGKDAMGMTRTELHVGVENIRTRKRLMAVIEVGFPVATKSGSTGGGKKRPDNHIQLRDRVAMLFSSGHGRSSIRWTNEEQHSFTGQALVDWLIDEGQVTGGIHEAVTEAQKVVESGWVVMIQPPAAETASAQAANADGASRPGDIFALSAVYKTCEMRWVEVGRTEPRRGPSANFNTTTSLMYALPASPTGGGADGIVITVTVFALAEDGVGKRNDKRMMLGGSPTSNKMDVDGNFKALLGTSFDNPDQVEVVATGSVALCDIVNRSEGWLCGPAPMQFPISLRAARPTDAGIAALPPDGMHVTDISSFVFESLVRHKGRGAGSSNGDDAQHGEVHITEVMSEAAACTASVAPQMLRLYSQRVNGILSSFDPSGGVAAAAAAGSSGGESNSALAGQRDLLASYQAFISDYTNASKVAHAAATGGAGAKTGGTFKPARLISDISRQFDATNLHTHTMHVEDAELNMGSTSYPVTTMGLPAAHALGFARGGLMHLQDEYMALRRDMTSQARTSAGVMGVEMLSAGTKAHMESLGIEIDKRKDIIMTQCVSALVAAFMASAAAFKPGNSAHCDDWWANSARTGYLLHFECVLNGSNRDQVILEDTVVGVRSLERVFLKIVDHPSANQRTPGNRLGPTVQLRRVSSGSGGGGGGGSHLQLDLYLGSEYPFSRLPDAVQRGSMIPVRTALFVHHPVMQGLMTVSFVFLAGFWCWFLELDLISFFPSCLCTPLLSIYVDPCPCPLLSVLRVAPYKNMNITSFPPSLSKLGSI